VGGGPGQGGIVDDIFDRPLVFVACNIMVEEIFDEAYATSAQTEGAGEVIARQVMYCRTHDSRSTFPCRSCQSGRVAQDVWGLYGGISTSWSPSSQVACLGSYVVSLVSALHKTAT
jgi:hypothetical protein